MCRSSIGSCVCRRECAIFRPKLQKSRRKLRDKGDKLRLIGRLRGRGSLPGHSGRERRLCPKSHKGPQYRRYRVAITTTTCGFQLLFRQSWERRKGQEVKHTPSSLPRAPEHTALRLPFHCLRRGRTTGLRP